MFDTKYDWLLTNWRSALTVTVIEAMVIVGLCMTAPPPFGILVSGAFVGIVIQWGYWLSGGFQQYYQWRRLTVEGKDAKPS